MGSRDGGPLGVLRGEIVEIDSSVGGLKIGRAAGQTIDHARIHLIPRREGDVANARVVYALSY